MWCEAKSETIVVSIPQSASVAQVLPYVTEILYRSLVLEHNHTKTSL